MYLQLNDNLTVFERDEENELVILVDDDGHKYELHTSPGYAEAFEQLYTELLVIYGSLEHRRGLQDRVDLVTRDERVKIKQVLDMAAMFR